MAKKIARKGAAPESVDNDLEILHPERPLVIGGKSITVREYGFVEGLHVREKAKDFIADLTSLFEKPETVYLDHIYDLLAKHQNVMLALIALSAGVDEQFVKSLNDTDGHDLMMGWWQANSDFFIRRVSARHAIQKKEQSRAGQTFTPPLSPSGTPQTESAATLSDK